MRHVLSALVQNVPGVLAHVAGMLASRGYNIDSLAVGETEDPALSRMTFVVVGDDSVLEQVRKQLEKIVTVVRVDDISSQDHVERDLMLMKVGAGSDRRSEIHELCAIFRGKVVDVSPDVYRLERHSTFARAGDRRDLGPGKEDRSVYRPHATLRHHRVGTHGPHCDGSRRRSLGGRQQLVAPRRGRECGAIEQTRTGNGRRETEFIEFNPSHVSCPPSPDY